MSLALFALGVVVFFAAVIWWALAVAGNVERSAHSETLSEERRRVEEKTGVGASRRLWRLVRTESLTRLRYAIQDEQRVTRGEISVEPLSKFRSQLIIGEETFDTVVQSRRSRFFGTAGGRAPDSLVVSEGGRRVYEAVPWSEGKTRGSRAVTTAGTLDVIWAPRSWRLVVESARIELDGKEVGEALISVDGSNKLLLALALSVPEAVVPWLLLTLQAGLYERNPGRARLLVHASSS